MKLYQVQFDNHPEKTYYVVERDPEKALIRAFTRALNNVMPGQVPGAGEVMEICDAKDLLLDILDALDENKSEESDATQP